MWWAHNPVSNAKFNLLNYTSGKSSRLNGGKSRRSEWLPCVRLLLTRNSIIQTIQSIKEHVYYTQSHWLLVIFKIQSHALISLARASSLFFLVPVTLVLVIPKKLPFKFSQVWFSFTICWISFVCLESNEITFRWFQMSPVS